MTKKNLWFPWFPFVLIVLYGCSLELDPKEKPRTVAIFDLEDGVIPLPSDLLRDDDAGRLDMPTDDETLSAADIAFRQFLNTQDAWSTAFPAKVEFSGPIDASTITKNTLRIWKMTPVQKQIDWEWDHETHSPEFDGPIVEINEENTKITVNPPRHGWDQGAKYFCVLLGGPRGVLDSARRVLGIDPAFYFMRQKQKLDYYENQRAFPGDNREERLEVAVDLEKMRLKLEPLFDLLESDTRTEEKPIPRDEIAALWSFSITENPELAMDRSSQRMPIPCDILIDPKTGLIDLQPAHWEEELETKAKSQINELAGSAVSANLMFELTSGVDPATVTPEVVKLYELCQTGMEATEIPLERIKVMSESGEEDCKKSPSASDCKYIIPVVSETYLPLKPDTRYAVIVFDGVTGIKGNPINPMLMGHFLRSEVPIVIDNQNQLTSVLSDEDANRLENQRAKVAPLLDHLGRDRIIAAWPFTTLEAVSGAEEAVRKAEDLGISPEPTIIKETPLTLLNRGEPFHLLFPGITGSAARSVYAYRLNNVAKIVEGTIKSPSFLGKETRAFRDDGGYEEEDVGFIMAVPENIENGKKVPVVIFGHAVVTDSRFLLTIAGALAKRGFASISIDFPYHGTRVACVDASLVTIPNFLPGILQDVTGFKEPLISLPPCISGEDATCAPTGECLDANGDPEPYNSFLNVGDKPAVMDFKPVSGAAFLDVEDIPHVSDHLLQALTDLGALKHSLKNGCWENIIGAPIDTENFYYVGQSLGGIIGSIFTAIAEDINRSVLNVPGADLIDLFIESKFFGPQIADYFVKEDIVEGTYEHERFVNIARWIIDSVDPHSIAHLHRTSAVKSLIQIDIGAPEGDIVIPNRATRILERVSQLPVREYYSNLHVDLVIPLIGEEMLHDMAAFLAGDFDQ